MIDKIIYAGTFDPITYGHLDIIQRGLTISKTLVIAIGVNLAKKNLFSIQKRISFIKKALPNNSQITIETYEGLTASFCKQQNCNILLRGIRNTLDFEYEKAIAQMNLENFSIETIFLTTSPKFSHISSSIIKELIANGKKHENYLPFNLKKK